ncbi:Kdo domain containing protein [Gramella lutea]|uniref:Kdo domain containing protein n=1 Tax=Christiangramia lutea TaxID=1607951 RepID=A0A9X1V6L3_9FLAO|nr:lipopolysaccharide kinase InaA family protein [Christiangramia lutea]MCH4823553.1 Kdo domain containing protein [Christiangramia lutea]
MNFKISPEYKDHQAEIIDLVKNFNEEGETIFQSRNTLKIVQINGKDINIKSFRIPNLVNQIAYRFFRKSKAQRSFEYASLLTSKAVGTPTPIAYFEKNHALTFGQSYYISNQMHYDLTYRELVTEPDYPDHEYILRAFTRFTFDLHEKQVQFLDHSPGNTLIQKEGGDYKFFLVDLNRMNFKELSFEERMLNFSRLTPKKEMVEIMADEYAKLIGRPKPEVFAKMWFYTNQFQEKFQRKKRIKKKLKFWKKTN